MHHSHVVPSRTYLAAMTLLRPLYGQVSESVRGVPDCRTDGSGDQRSGLSPRRPVGMSRSEPCTGSDASALPPSVRTHLSARRCQLTTGGSSGGGGGSDSPMTLLRLPTSGRQGRTSPPHPLPGRTAFPVRDEHPFDRDLKR